jgi:hypothetical protein
MTRFTPTPTPHTGDENPGGTIRQDRGFGLGESAIFPTGKVRLGNVRSLQPASPMGEAGRNVGKRTNFKAGGPFSASRSFRSVIGKGTLRGAMFAQAGGLAARHPTTLAWRLPK